MSLWHAALLGVLQGVTEFLPVSSSGHLALAQMVVPGFTQPGVVFDAMLHVGTAAAVIVFERRQLAAWLVSREGWKMFALLALGTIATAGVAFPLRTVAEGAFLLPAAVGAALILTGFVVLACRWLPGGTTEGGSTRPGQVILIGLAQGLAVFPGLSRSGSTIAAGLGVGLDRRWAARFSFLLSLPAIAGATVVELLLERHQLVAVEASFWATCGIGAAAAAISGFVALHMVLRTLSARSFHRFAWYCLPFGALVLAAAAAGVLP